MTAHIYSKINDVLADIYPVISKKIPNEAPSLILKANEKLAQDSLRVQLYGSYNAGKSSFINLLLGENHANVGDIPVTDKIDIYNWNGIKLLDSPGVNAPIEHEEVTLEQLKSVDLVVFVIRYGDHDTKDVYKRLVELMESGKHVFVIINYEALEPTSSGEDGTAFITSYVLSKIHEFHKVENKNIPHEIYKKLKIIPINIKTAIKAKCEGKQLLLEHSGYNDFDRTFNEWISDLNNEKELILGIKKFIVENLLNPVVKIMESEDTLTDIQKQKLALAKLENDSNRQISAAKNQIRLIANQNKGILINGLDTAKNEIDLKNVIEDYFDKSIGEVSQWIEIELSEKATMDLMFKVPENNVFNESNAVSEMLNSSLGLGFSYLKQNPQLFEEGIKLSLTFIKKQLPTLMKGKGPVAISKMAGKAAPLINVALVAYDMYSASSEQDKLNQAEQNRAYQQGKLVEDIKNQFISGSIEQVVRVLEEARAQMIQKINGNLIILEKSHKEAVSDREILLGLKNKLDSIV